MSFHPQTHVRTHKSTRMTINQCFLLSHFSTYSISYLHFGFIMWRRFKLTSRNNSGQFNLAWAAAEKRLWDLSPGHKETYNELKKMYVDDGKPTLLLHCFYTHSANEQQMIDGLATSEEISLRKIYMILLWMKRINR